MEHEKYFNREGTIAFKLWLYSIAIEALKKEPNLERVRFLHWEISQYLQSHWVRKKATEEERGDLQSIMAEIDDMKKDLEMMTEDVPGVQTESDILFRLWLFGQAFEALQAAKEPLNKEKVEALAREVGTFSSSHLVELHANDGQRKEIKDMMEKIDFLLRS